MTDITYKTANEPPGGASFLDSRARVPQHVVYREFVNETVVLNLKTGTYHGLNPTAGLMLRTIDKLGILRDALEQLAEEHAWANDEVEADFVELCHKLAERGLVEFDNPSSLQP